jgi:hypothetical protein
MMRRSFLPVINLKAALQPWDEPLCRSSLMLLAIDAIVPSSAFVHPHYYEMIRRHPIARF